MIEDIIEIAKKNGAEVTKNGKECGIGYTDDNGFFHSIDVKEVILKPVPIEITEGIKAISEYCNSISGCGGCALVYKGGCLFDTSVANWANYMDTGDCTILDRKEKEASWIVKDDINNLAYCSKCNHCEDSRKLTNYCSCCGAKMEDVVRNYDV